MTFNSCYWLPKTQDTIWAKLSKPFNVFLTHKAAVTVIKWDEVKENMILYYGQPFGSRTPIINMYKWNTSIQIWNISLIRLVLIDTNTTKHWYWYFHIWIDMAMTSWSCCLINDPKKRAQCFKTKSELILALGKGVKAGQQGPWSPDTLPGHC